MAPNDLRSLASLVTDQSVRARLGTVRRLAAWRRPRGAAPQLIVTRVG